MSAECVVNVRLLDVNDNVPKLVENKVFFCAKNPKPVILKATDGDNPPFAQPFTFVLGSGKNSPNWDLTTVDGTEEKKKERTQHRTRCKTILLFFHLTGSTARLTLKKIPTKDFIITLPINIKDHAGMGVSNSLLGKRVHPSIHPSPVNVQTCRFHQHTKLFTPSCVAVAKQSASPVSLSLLTPTLLSLSLSTFSGIW